MFHISDGGNGETRTTSVQTDKDSFLTANTHQHLYPTLRTEVVKQEPKQEELTSNLRSRRCSSSGKASSRGHASSSQSAVKVRSTTSSSSPSLSSSGKVTSQTTGDEFTTARSSSPQLTQLLTTPPCHNDATSSSGKAGTSDLGKAVGSSNGRPTSVSFQQKRRSPTRQKSPLATSASKAPQLLTTSGCSKDPIPSAPSIEVLQSELLGKRDAQSLQGKASQPKRVKISTPPKQGSISLTPKGQGGSVKNSPSLPRKVVKSPSGSGNLSPSSASPRKSLLARATGTVIGKLLQARRPSL